MIHYTEDEIIIIIWFIIHFRNYSQPLIHYTSLELIIGHDSLLNNEIISPFDSLISYEIIHAYDSFNFIEIIMGYWFITLSWNYSIGRFINSTWNYLLQLIHYILSKLFRIMIHSFYYELLSPFNSLLQTEIILILDSLDAVEMLYQMIHYVPLKLLMVLIHYLYLKLVCITWFIIPFWNYLLA